MHKKTNLKMFLKKYWLVLYPYISIFIISCIPIIYSFGRLNIGGDMIIPFNSVSLEKYLFQWLNVQNGQYFSINYYPLYFFYRITDFFNLSVYCVSVIFLFLLNFIAGIGILKTARLFSSKKNYVLLFPVIFYMFSPALLNSWHYIFIYSFAPLFFYFIFKIIKNKNVGIFDIIFLNILLFFISIDLPNPKYVFHIFVISLLIFIISFLLKLIDKCFFTKNLPKIGLFFLLSAYLFLPLFNFANNYKAEYYGTKTRVGYKDTGKFMDEGSTTIDKMFRIHSDGLVINIPEQKKYKLNNLVQILSYTFIATIILLFFKKNNFTEEKKYKYIFLFLVILYLFFAVGPNPPFGFIYKLLLSSIPLLAFFRTTAGAVFFLSLFYSLLLFLFLKNLPKKKQKIYFVFLLVSLLIVSYPLINGEFYKNVNAFNQFTDREEYGYRIPNEYFIIKSYLDNSKIEGKLFFPGSNLSYLNTKWGYSGPMFYNFLYKNTPIYDDGIGYLPQFHNINFLLEDNSENNQFKGQRTIEKDNFKEVKRSNFLILKKTDENKFLPIFYIAKNIVVSPRAIEELPRIVSSPNWQIRSVVFFEGQNAGKEEMLGELKSFTSPQPSPQIGEGDFVLPVLEFKKINPTKYRVRVHSAKGEFPLVFSESFHEGWKGYLTPVKSGVADPPLAEFNGVNNYKILDGNEEDQSSTDELKDFINKGWVTSLGNGKEKTIEHKKWENNKEKLDYTERYNIDFISKNFQGTIQNDNLPNGNIFETWFKKPLLEENHLMANGYANAWVIDTESLCSTSDKTLNSKSETLNNIQNSKFKIQNSSGFCTQNPDGSYDFEIVVEFWPQRLFYIGLLISSLTLLGCISFLGYDFYRRRKSKVDQKVE